MRAGEFGTTADTTSNKVQRLAQGFGRALVAGVGAAVTSLGAAGAAVFSYVNDATSALDATNKLSAALGINSEELQRLQFAAKQSGLSQANLEKGVRNLNKGLLEVSQGGGKKFNEALGEIGLSASALDGHSQAEQIGLIGDRLNEIGSQAERSALAAQIFGQRAGPEMATLLRAGSNGIAELMGQAKNVFSQEDLDRASAFQDRLGEIRDAAGRLGTAVAVELLPHVAAVAEATADWIRENEALIRQGLAQVFGEIGAAVGAVRNEVEAIRGAFKLLNIDVGEFGVAADGARFALDGMRSVMGALLSPMRTAGNQLQSLTGYMRKLGLVSAGTAQNLALVFGQISGKNDEQIKDLVKMIQDHAANPGEKRTRDEPTVSTQRLVTPSGGGGRVAPPVRRSSKKEKEPEKPKAKVVTMEDLRRRLLSGDLSAMRENLASLSSSSASIADTKPSVVIHHTDNSVHNNVDIAPGAITVEGAGAPKDVAGEVLKQLGGEIQKGIIKNNSNAAHSIPNTVVR